MITQVPALGTPGGDFAELAAGIAAYLKLLGLASNSTDGLATTKAIFAAFMDQVATPERPFYLHTSDEKLHKIFKARTRFEFTTHWGWLFQMWILVVSPPVRKLSRTSSQKTHSLPADRPSRPPA